MLTKSDENAMCFFVYRASHFDCVSDIHEQNNGVWGMEIYQKADRCTTLYTQLPLFHNTDAGLWCAKETYQLLGKS